MTECRLCRALERFGWVPAVAALLARLTDELAVQTMLETSTPAAQPALGRLADWRRERRERIVYWRSILESLSHGPLPLELLCEDLHGPPVADPVEMAARRKRTVGVVGRLYARGLVVRVSWATYAIPSNTGGMVDRTREDLRRLLSETGHGRPRDGFTVPEIADRFEVSPKTVRTWLERFKAQNIGLVITHQPRSGKHGPGYSRYRIEARARGGQAASRLRPAGSGVFAPAAAAS